MIIFTVYELSQSSLNNLKEVKCQLEGTSVTYKHTTVNENVLQELRQLILMHTAASMTDACKKKIQELVQESLRGMNR